MFDKTTTQVLTAVTGLEPEALNSQFYTPVEGEEGKFNPIEGFETKLSELVTNSLKSKTTTASEAAIEKAKAEWLKNQPKSYKAALKEIALKNGVKIEKDDFDPNNVFSAITGKMSEAAVTDALKNAEKKEVTEEDVKRHPYFTEFEKTVRDGYESKLKEWGDKFEATNTEYQTYKQQIESEKINTAVESGFNAVVSSMNPTVQNGEEKLLISRKDAALNIVRSKYDVGVDEDGKPVLYEKGSGKGGESPVVARDKNQNPLKFDTVSKEAFRMLHNSFASSKDEKGTPKGSGSKNEESKGGSDGSGGDSNENLVIEGFGKLPTNEAEVRKFQKKGGDFKYRNALRKWLQVHQTELK